MKNENRNKLFTILMCTVLIILSFPLTARADIGPKASVRVQFEHMGDELCYATLLSERSSTGPYYIWDGNEERIRNFDLEQDIWRVFVEYEDTDGYYFLQTGWKVSETKEIAWTYYPPGSFKILLYYPETGEFIVSDIYERYAFDTYYTVDMDGSEIEVYRSYDYQTEILSLIARIIITILIEMAVAWVFGFRKKKQLMLLIGVNTATQIILNVLLNIVNYRSGEWAFVFFYVLFELLVFIIEAVMYGWVMNRWSESPKKKGFYVAYAFVANAVSFTSGMIVAQMLPGIF